MLFIRPIDSAQYVLELKPQDAPLVTSNRPLIQALELLPARFTQASAFASWTEMNEIDKTVVWEFLIEEKLNVLESEYFEQLELFGNTDDQSDWQDAKGYHMAVRDYPFLDMGEKDAVVVDNEIMKRYEGVRETPDVYQDFNTGKGLQLRYIEDILNAEEAIEGGLCVQALTLIVDTAFGERGRYDRTYHENIKYLEMAKLLKAVPSGGGRHPAEGFLLAKGVRGLADGLYHYSVRIHALERLSDGAELMKQIADPEISQQLFVLIAPILERAMWRYREPRSWRAVAVDTGHVIGAMTAAASLSGLSSQALTRYETNECCRAIGISAEDQPVLAIVEFKE
jgi:SagB-type dehydrogenase family enzyme